MLLLTLLTVGAVGISSIKSKCNEYDRRNLAKKNGTNFYLDNKGLYRDVKVNIKM